jgi:hypothetical protein
MEGYLHDDLVEEGDLEFVLDLVRIALEFDCFWLQVDFIIFYISQFDRKEYAILPLSPFDVRQSSI